MTSIWWGCRLSIGSASNRESLRLRIAALYAALVTFNVGAWIWALVAFRGNYLLLGTAAAAYGFGLRHAVDADHIAAIDNVTRKLMQERQSPLGVGAFFALGHSSVVMLASVMVALTASSLAAGSAALEALGATIGTVISFALLWIIGAFNLLYLRQILAALRRVRRAGRYEQPRLESILAQQGFAARWLRPLFRLIRRSPQMFALGALFGLGFDTATEVLLLGIAAGQAAHGMALSSILLFPLLFAAGMTLVDATDGVLMMGAYGWAFVDPARKLYYNVLVTALSVTVAFGVGGAEALSLLRERVGLKGGIGSLATGIAGHMDGIGCAIIGTFLACWLVSLAVQRLQRERAPITQPGN
jgi:nickel/cobalt transporter (NiCoT) family protein